MKFSIAVNGDTLTAVEALGLSLARLLYTDQATQDQDDDVVDQRERRGLAEVDS